MHITVVIDVLRFTTSACAAFTHGVKSIIPVGTIAEARAFKHQGFRVAGELDGLKLDFADYGNSPSDFDTPEIAGSTIAYSTTNGTKALVLAAENGPVVIAAFPNLHAVAAWLKIQNSDVVILCSGWKNLVCVEDTLCAGALTALLLETGNFGTNCDSAEIALSYWKQAQNNPAEYVEKASHYSRLINLGVNPMLGYSLQIGTSAVVPVFNNGSITDWNTEN